MIKHTHSLNFPSIYPDFHTRFKTSRSILSSTTWTLLEKHPRCMGYDYNKIQSLPGLIPPFYDRCSLQVPLISTHHRRLLQATIPALEVFLYRQVLGGQTPFHQNSLVLNNFLFSIIDTGITLINGADGNIPTNLSIQSNKGYGFNSLCLALFFLC